MLALLACPAVLLTGARTAVLSRQPVCSGTRGCRGPCPIAMQLRAPEDDGTIDALIEQTQRTNSIVVIYYADPSAFAEPKWSDSWGETPEPTVRDDIVSRIARLCLAAVRRPTADGAADRPRPAGHGRHLRQARREGLPNAAGLVARHHGDRRPVRARGEAARSRHPLARGELDTRQLWPACGSGRADRRCRLLRHRHLQTGRARGEAARGRRPMGGDLGTKPDPSRRLRRRWP